MKFLSRFTYSFNSIYWGLISWSLFWSPVIKKWTRTTFLVCGAYILESTERQWETRKNRNTGTVSVERWAEEDKRQQGGGMGRRAELHNSSGLLWTGESLSSDGDLDRGSKTASGWVTPRAVEEHSGRGIRDGKHKGLMAPVCLPCKRDRQQGS